MSSFVTPGQTIGRVVDGVSVGDGAYIRGSLICAALLGQVSIVTDTVDDKQVQCSERRSLIDS